MAGPNDGATQSLPKLKIEAVMTVTPLKVTEPRRVRHVLVSKPNISPETFRGCCQVVLYYEQLKEEDCGCFLAGWTVESLGRALLEHPLLAGRLQKRDDDDREMEIVSNDCGIRIVEAQMSITLSEFLESSQKDDLEAELVFWKDIDEKNPEFSPLFYVQVTNFECGGYSIGISCSLLLAEILVVDNFLKKWAEIHNNILSPDQDTKTPLFYHPRLKNSESPPTNIISRTPSKNGSQSLVFKTTAEDLNFERELAMHCVEEAEQKLHRKMGSDSEYSMFVKESSEVIKVENWSKSEYSMQLLGLKNQITLTTLDDFGVSEVAFHEGNKPVLVSRWIESVSDGNVVVVPYPKEGVTAAIIVTLPVEKRALN